MNQTPSSSQDKLALICGGGEIPLEIAHGLAKSGRPFCIIRLIGLSDIELANYPGHEVALGDFPALFSLLKAEDCASVCMVGSVKRPDFQNLSKNTDGSVQLASIERAGHGGDDQLLRQVITVFEQQGFRVEGAHEVNPGLLLDGGLIAGDQPDDSDARDVNIAVTIAMRIGELDIGQAAVVCRGLCLAVEAQEGTEAMLRRVTELPTHLRGRDGNPKGVLVKWIKPIQDDRIDMPTIGVSTLEVASEAGIKGIVGPAGGLLIVNKTEVIKKAKALGMFLLGIDPQKG